MPDYEFPLQEERSSVPGAPPPVQRTLSGKMLLPADGGTSTQHSRLVSSSSSLLLSRLELSDTKVYEPEIRALLGTDGGTSTQHSRPVFPKVISPKGIRPKSIRLEELEPAGV